MKPHVVKLNLNNNNIIYILRFYMSSLVFPPEIEDATAFPSYIQFDIWDRQTTFNSNLTDQIILYMPDEITSPNTTQWDTDSMQALLGQSIGGKVGTFIRNISGAKSQIFQYTTGVVPNPQLILLFRGVDFRRFTMTFIFSPRTEAESMTIDKIVRMFRAHSVPKGSKDDMIQVMFTYPSEFIISHKFKGNDNPFLPKFSKSALTRVDANYMDTGQYSIHRIGAPVRTKLELEFTEKDVILRDDILYKGY